MRQENLPLAPCTFLINGVKNSTTRLSDVCVSVIDFTLPIPLCRAKYFERPGNSRAPKTIGRANGTPTTKRLFRKWKYFAESVCFGNSPFFDYLISTHFNLPVANLILRSFVSHVLIVNCGSSALSTPTTGSSRQYITTSDTVYPSENMKSFFCTYDYNCWREGTNGHKLLLLRM